MPVLKLYLQAKSFNQLCLSKPKPLGRPLCLHTLDSEHLHLFQFHHLADGCGSHSIPRRLDRNCCQIALMIHHLLSSNVKGGCCCTEQYGCDKTWEGTLGMTLIAIYLYSWSPPNVVVREPVSSLWLVPTGDSWCRRQGYQL